MTIASFERIPINEAAHIFVQETKSDYIAAEAFLPKHHCDGEHEGFCGNAPSVTEAQLKQAMTDYAQAQYEEEYDL